MSLESATYISDLNTANPTGTDPKAQGDDHLRLIKSTLKTTFPNVTGAVTPTHTELNYVDGVTSAIQTQIDTKGAHAGQTWTGTHDFTGATLNVPTAADGDADTSAASTAFVDTYFAKKASPTLTGTPVAPTASPGTNTTQIATTAFVQQQAFSTALPTQTGNDGKFLKTDGTNAAWTAISNYNLAKSANYTLSTSDQYYALTLTSSATLTLPSASSAGDGFNFYVRNSGTGVWVIDPNGSETIDGLTTIYVYPGEGFKVICDGSGWRTFGRSRLVRIGSYTVSSAVATIDIETQFADTELTRHYFDLQELTLATGARPSLRIKKSSSYQTSNYNGVLAYDSGGSYTAVAWTTAAYLHPSNTFTPTVLSGEVYIDSVANGQKPIVRSLVTAVSTSSGNQNIVSSTGVLNVTSSAIQGVRFLDSDTGLNITAGTIYYWAERG